MLRRRSINHRAQTTAQRQRLFTPQVGILQINRLQSCVSWRQTVAGSHAVDETLLSDPVDDRRHRLGVGVQAVEHGLPLFQDAFAVVDTHRFEPVAVSP